MGYTVWSISYRVTYIHISQFCNSKLLIEYYRKQPVTVNDL